MMNKKKTKNDMLEINNSIKDNNMTKTTVSSQKQHVL